MVLHCWGWSRQSLEFFSEGSRNHSGLSSFFPSLPHLPSMLYASCLFSKRAVWSNLPLLSYFWNQDPFLFHLFLQRQTSFLPAHSHPSDFTSGNVFSYTLFVQLYHRSPFVPSQLQILFIYLSLVVLQNVLSGVAWSWSACSFLQLCYFSVLMSGTSIRYSSFSLLLSTLFWVQCSSLVTYDTDLSFV